MEDQGLNMASTAIQDNRPETHQKSIPGKQGKLTNYHNPATAEKTTTASNPNTKLGAGTIQAQGETGGPDPGLKMNLEQNREQRKNREADIQDLGTPDASLDTHNQQGNQMPSPGLNRITGKQELNTTKATWITESGITILPLGGEKPEIYFGSEALPTDLLNKLQIQNQEY